MAKVTIIGGGGAKLGKFSGLIALALFMACLHAAAALPEVRPVKTSRPPKIDGKLDDICWRSAAKVGNFVARLENLTPEVPTEAYLLYDNEKLYVAFKCHEPNVAGLRAVDHADQFWAEGKNDAVLVFVGPQEKERPYYQLGVNFKGVKYERGHLAGRNEDYKDVIDAAVARGESSWTAEIAIPFKLLKAGEQMGKVWRLNLCRQRAQNRENSTWAPVNAIWKNPGLFGTLKGLIIGGSPERPKVYLRECVLRPPVIGQNTARIKVKARKKTQVKITTATKTPTGERAQVVKEVSLERREIKELTLPFDISAVEGDHELRFTFTDASTGEVLYESPKASLAVASLLDAYFVRSYYTTERQARLGMEVAMPDDKLAEMRIEMEFKDATGKVQASKTINSCKKENFTELAIAKLATGDYEAAITLKDKNGKVISRAIAPFRKLPPNPGDEVKIDRIRRCMLVNGKPTLGVGAIFPIPGKLDMIKDIGFNHVHSIYAFHGNGVSRSLDLIDKGEKAGIRVTGSLFHASRRFNQFFEEYFPDRAEEVVRSALASGNTLFYDMIGEPGPRQMPSMTKLHKMIREIDPYHPTTAVYCRRTTAGDNYDMAALDAYWGAGLRDRAPLEIVSWIASSTKIAKKQRMPLCVVLMAGRVSFTKREQTDREERLQTYLALIYGAKAISWFGIWDPPNIKDHWLELGKLVKELRALEPILTERTPTQSILKKRGVGSPLHMLAMRHKNKLYILAANAFTKDAQVSIDLSKIVKTDAKVKVWFENRKLRLSGTTLTDKFLGYSTHVYEVALSKNAAEPYKIEVAVAELDSGYDVDAYFVRKTAWYHPYRDTITLTGTGHTLESVARDIGDSAIFAYDKATRTAKTSKNIHLMGRGSLTIGDEKDPLKKEVLECRSLRANGDLRLVNATLDGGWVKGSTPHSRLSLAEQGTLRGKNSVISGFRYGPGARRTISETVAVTKLEDCEIRGCGAALHNSSRGTYIRCKIYDNDLFVRAGKDRYVRGQPLIFIDSEVYAHEESLKYMGKRHCVYINTSDDNLGKYTFTTGSATVGWHVVLKPAEAGKARQGLKVWLDTEGDKFDRNGETDTQGVCKLDGVQYVSDKDGRKEFTYEVKVSEDGKAWRALKSGVAVTANLELEY